MIIIRHCEIIANVVRIVYIISGWMNVGVIKRSNSRILTVLYLPPAVVVVVGFVVAGVVVAGVVVAGVVVAGVVVAGVVVDGVVVAGVVVVGADVVVVVGVAVVGADVAVVAGTLQVTLQPMAPLPFFLLSLINSTMKSEADVNTKFLLLPQTLNKKIKLDKSRF